MTMAKLENRADVHMLRNARCTHRTDGSQSSERSGERCEREGRLGRVREGSRTCPLPLSLSSLFPLCALNRPLASEADSKTACTLFYCTLVCEACISWEDRNAEKFQCLIAISSDLTLACCVDAAVLHRGLWATHARRRCRGIRTHPP